MPKIDWRNDTRLDDELFEDIVACLLQNDHPTATRIRLSRGDGGVDVLAPHPEGGWIVFQCKFYRDKIHWSKVEDSLDSLEENDWLEGGVKQWFLVVPQNPQGEVLAELRTRTLGRAFPCDWFGEAQLDELLARMPEVHEYYLGDGRKRLEQRLDDFSNMERVLAGDSPGMADIAPRIEEFQNALNRDDPHLRYFLATSPGPNPPPALPNALYTQTVPLGQDVLTLTATPRYRGADIDAAERLSGTLRLSPSAAESLMRLTQVGGDRLVLEGNEVAGIDFPALKKFQGFDDHLKLERVEIAALQIDDPARLDLVVSVGSDTARVQLERVSLSPGSVGATSVWRSRGGAIIVSSVADGGADRVDFTIRPEPVGGARIVEILDDIPALWLLAERAHLTLQVPGTSASVQLDRMEEPLLPKEMCLMLESLRVLQLYVTELVTVPQSFTVADVTAATQCAIMLTGQDWVDGFGNASARFDSMDELTDALRSGLHNLTFDRTIGSLTIAGHDYRLKEKEARVLSLAPQVRMGEPVIDDDGTVEVNFLAPEGGKIFSRLVAGSADAATVIEELQQSSATPLTVEAAGEILCRHEAPT